MQERKDLESANRKAYRRPTLERVSLRPEEAVLGGCKVAGVQAKNVAGSSYDCTIPVACLTTTS